MSSAAKWSPGPARLRSSSSLLSYQSHSALTMLSRHCAPSPSGPLRFWSVSSCVSSRLLVGVAVGVVHRRRVRAAVGQALLLGGDLRLEVPQLLLRELEARPLMALHHLDGLDLPIARGARVGEPLRDRVAIELDLAVGVEAGEMAAARRREHDARDELGPRLLERDLRRVLLVVAGRVADGAVEAVRAAPRALHHHVAVLVRRRLAVDPLEAALAVPTAGSGRSRSRPRSASARSRCRCRWTGRCTAPRRTRPVERDRVGLVQGQDGVDDRRVVVGRDREVVRQARLLGRVEQQRA